jgi:hypothetical protein
MNTVSFGNLFEFSKVDADINALYVINSHLYMVGENYGNAYIAKSLLEDRILDHPHITKNSETMVQISHAEYPLVVTTRIGIGTINTRNCPQATDFSTVTVTTLTLTTYYDDDVIFYLDDLSFGKTNLKLLFTYETQSLCLFV